MKKLSKSKTLKKALVRVSPKGVVTLPEWACELLLKSAGCKGKSPEYQHRVIRREFMKLLKDYVELAEKNE